MITKCNLPEEIRLPSGEILKPVIGGHLEQKPFLTVEHSGVDVTENGWGAALFRLDPDPERAEQKLILAEAKRRGLRYRKVGVLARGLRGRMDLHSRPYRANVWVFVQTN